LYEIYSPHTGDSFYPLGVVPGIQVSSFLAAVVVALVLGILNTLIKPVLLILTFPLTILTLGLWILCINTLLFIFAAKVVAGFAVSSLFAAFFGSLLVSIVSTVTYRLVAPK
jgi:putative membrane protein